MNSRAIALWLHRYLGLALLFFVFSAGLTGSLLVFRHELDYALNADAVRVSAGARRLAIGAMVNALASQRPGARVERFVIGKTPDQAWLFTLAGGDGAKAVNELWVNPYTGAIQGERTAGEIGLDRRHLMTTIWTWHSSLFIGTPGKTALGAISVLWLISSLIGIYLALQRGQGLLAALRIKRKASTFRTIYDSHRAAGLASILVLFVSLFTAANLALPDLSRYLVSIVSATNNPMPQALPDRPGHGMQLGFDEALAIAGEVMPGATPTGLVSYPRKGVYLVRFRTADDIASTHGTGRVILDTSDGLVLHSETFRRTGAAGNAFLTWMFPLHSGQAFGMPGRVLILSIGLVPVFLALSGFWIWRQKRRNQLARADRAVGAPPQARPG